MARVISISGGAGVGKSTLLSGVAERVGDTFVVPEHVGVLHYLPLFYADSNRYALHSRLEFLLLKVRQLMAVEEAHRFAVLDRSVPELITFARALLATGVMSRQDFDLYEGVYHLLLERIRPIDFVIWVRAAPDVMLERIKARGRPFEQGISRAYLDAIEVEYVRWFAALPTANKIVIDTSTVGPEDAADMAATWLMDID